MSFFEKTLNEKNNEGMKRIKETFEKEDNEKKLIKSFYAGIKDAFWRPMPDKKIIYNLEEVPKYIDYYSTGYEKLPNFVVEKDLDDEQIMKNAQSVMTSFGFQYGCVARAIKLAYVEQFDEFKYKENIKKYLEAIGPYLKKNKYDSMFRPYFLERIEEIQKKNSFQNEEHKKYVRYLINKII